MAGMDQVEAAIGEADLQVLMLPTADQIGGGDAVEDLGLAGGDVGVM